MIVAAAKSAVFRQRFSNDGLQPLLTTSDEFTKIFAADAKVWNDIMPTLGLKKN